MGNLGIITGRVIGKNRDGDKDRVLLQVEILEEDVRTIEMISQAGEDVNPGNGCRVYYETIEDDGYLVSVAVTDDLTPEVSPGEKEFYSTDSPVTQKLARLLLDGFGNVVHNQGAKSAVTHAELNTALQSLVTALNAALATKADAAGAAGTLTVDISAAESATVKLP